MNHPHKTSDLGLTNRGTNSEEFKLMAELTNLLLDNSLVFNKALDRILERLGRVLDVDRSYFFRSRVTETGAETVDYTNEWCAEGIEAFLGAPELENVTWDSMPDVFEEMLKGHVFYGHVVEHPSEFFREIMTLQGIQSYLFFPIHIEGQFFGFVGFDSCSKKREWTENERSFLQTLGGLIAHRILREGLSAELNTQLLMDKQIGTMLAEMQHLHEMIIRGDLGKKLLHRGMEVGKAFFQAEALVVGELEEENETHYRFKVLDKRGIFFQEALPFLSDLPKECLIQLTSDSNLEVDKNFSNLFYFADQNKAGSKLKNTWIERFSSQEQRGYILVVFNISEPLARCGQAFFKNFTSSLESLAFSLATKLDQLKSERMVRESEQRFRLLSENTNDIIILHDPDGYFQYVSPKVKDILGYDPKDLLGKHFLDFDFGRENQKLVGEVLDKLNEGQDYPLVNLWYRSKDRTYEIALQSSFSRVLDEEGKLIGFVSSSRDITAESHAKKALENSERQFRLISENVRDIIALHHDDLTFYWASPSFYQMMEVTAADIEGKQPHQIWPTRNRKVLHEDPAKGVSTIEVEHQLKSGKWVWLEVTISPFEDEDIGFHGTMALSRNISERKAYEEQLYRQRNSFEAILEGSLSGYWYFYPQDNKQYISPKFKKLLGYDEHEIGEDPDIWEHIMPQADLSRLFRKIDIHSKSQAKFPLFEEVRYRHKSGKLLHIICAGQVLKRDKEGVALEMAGAYIDLTYVREVENKLIRTESALQLILQKTRLVIWIRDVDSNEIIYLSDSAKALFDVTKTTMKRGEKFYYKNIHPEDEERVRQVLQTPEYLEEGKVDVKYRIKTSSGEYIWLRTRGFTITDQQGKLFRVGISEDVSQQQLWEKELESTLQKERELNAMKSYFISMVSHQFRTPMAIMQTNTELVDMVLERTAPEVKPKVEKYTNRIHGEITRLTSLLSDVLILEKSRLGKLNLNLSDVHVAGMVEEIVEDFNTQSRNSGEFVAEVDAKNIHLKLDESYLRHALVNIIGNAYKYTPENRPAPRVSVSKTAKEIMILVEDSGIGIDDNDINTLFNPFFRGSNTANFQGTGLGLVIAKEFIEEMQGEILISSQLEIGSTFAIMLPLRRRKK